MDPVETPEGGHQAKAPRRCRLLVIDDEPLVGYALRRCLGREHDVTTVTDARVALERIAAGERFDLILCDLMMPELTGMEFHDRLAELAPSVLPSVVFVTAGVWTQRAHQFLKTVRNTCLDKPLDLSAVKALLHGRGYGPAPVAP